MVDVAFSNIGFHAALILNRLRNERALTNEAEDFVTGEDKKTDRDREGCEDNAERTQGATVIGNRKRSSR